MPVADEVFRLQSKKAPDCLLFQRFCEEGHYGGRTVPTNTRQGIYAVTSGGKFLASCNTRRAREVQRMLERALTKWKQLQESPDAELSDADAKSLSRVHRYEDRYPEDGLVLQVVSRDLPGALELGWWHKTAWNLDYAWFKKHEAEALVPEKPEIGARREVPKRLAERLVRFHLVDNVRGQTPAFEAADVKTARMSTKLASIDGDLWKLEIEGTTATNHEGGPWARGVETKLVGRATWNAKRKSFVAFELLARGKRWGRTRYNSRGGDVTKKEPIGFALVLAPRDAGCRVAPAAIWRYRW